jgi:signal transduction histidine kinase
MLKDLSRQKIGMVLCFTVLGVIIITASVIMTFNIHRNEIIKQQKEQIITTAETASRGLETFFREKRRGMDLYFNGVVQYMEEEDLLNKQMEAILDQYYQKEKAYLYEIDFLTKEILKENRILVPATNNNAFYGSYNYQEACFYVLDLFKPLYLGKKFLGVVKASINLNTVYDEILYPIQIGEKGYCTVKDRNGIILMHGTKSQIGIDSKEDRKKQHPELDGEGINRLVENQIRGESGSNLVVSYWWDNLEAGKVKKIIGYTPVSVVADFWVVSVIMEYALIADILHRTLGMSIGIGILLVFFFVSLIFYITKELKNAQRMHMEWMYERELNEAAYRLKKQEEKVQQYDRLQTLGMLTGTIAHEFNNLMTPIMIYCDLLKDQIQGKAEMKEEVEEITIAARRCTELSKQLLDYGRTEHTEGKPVVFDAALVTKNTIKMFEKLLPKEVLLLSYICKDPVLILGNPGALNQIIINLCTNAYQVMKEKGGKIQLSLTVKENKAVLLIEDNGYGMDKTIMENIFEPFYTTKKPGEGTGLGLPVVKKLVKGMKGTILVESETGKGTIFTLTFPIQAAALEQSKGKVEHHEYIVNKEYRIILLDDKPDIVKSIKKALAKTNWIIEGYTNPTTVYAKLKEQANKFDILLTDNSMPVVNGMELSTVIKRLNPHIKIILMTGYPEKELQEYIDKGIIDSYLIKPVSETDIIVKIDELYLNQ